MTGAEPFLLFDDARPPAPAVRLYSKPAETVAARTLDEVRPALAEIRRQTRLGNHAAGFLAYEAGYALEPALAGCARQGSGPLIWFGIFERFDTLDGAELRGFLPDPGGSWLGAPRPRISRDSYLELAAQVRELLFAGEIYQANLTFGCDVPLLGGPLAAYARLRSAAGAGWGGVVCHPGGWILSLSPEQFFTIRNGMVEARPMKGTAARRRDAASDSAQALALAADPKQRAENLMIVDLLRNDLARIAETGSVEVPELFAVETYPTLHQLVSRVTARLRGGLNPVDVLEAIFPCGSVTGAPKISAMRHLARLETEARGAYTGAMGWIEPGGDAAFNVMIRTLELPECGGSARLGLGSGVVVDSIAADEWAECLLKGTFVSRATRTPDLVETMRFHPEEGVLELERHFERLRESADALGLRFDRHAARNELQAATFGRKTPGVARLLLSPTGTIAIEVKSIEPVPDGPVRVAVRPLPVDPSDFRLRHKTADRRFYDDARRESGAFEAVFTDPDGFITEGSFTSVFVERDGRLLTPSLDRPILPGILRRRLIEEGRAVESDLRPDDLAGGFFIGNAVRGLIAAKLA